MKIQVYKALWGMDGRLEQQFERIAAAGYDGAEVWLSGVEIDRQLVLRLAEQYQLRLIVAGAIATAEELLPTLQAFSEYNPVKINVQSGLDAMSLDEGKRYVEAALEAERKIGVTVMQETHRGKLLFAPWVAAAYLREFPGLHITADYSHWVNVCERLPVDQAETLALANDRARHIHGRVGYEEGPQVPDPSAPEYAAQLAWHEAQWQAIADAHAARGDDMLTFTPEYGPQPYLHTLPHTNVPVANLWDVCLWAAKRAREKLV
ncbi:MAG: sugar phosphate isomerase/epimerase [Chloroflexi bacterium]|nr:sugar phosphate isomerase/epimerase [Chloroflexota bacterium]MCC6892853.1 sugar phosphate isomerase/epimerase [Anaerolineae bacterium]